MKTIPRLSTWISIALCTFSLLGTFIKAASQDRFETGISMGTMQYEGDVGGRFYSKLGDLLNSTSKPRFALSGNVGFHMMDFLTLRASVTLGAVRADDALLKPGLSPKIDYKIQRNLSFQTNISELSIAAEIYPMPIFQYGYVKEAGKINPYLVFGASGFLFNPKSIYKDPLTGEMSLVELKPLKTEGQGMGLPTSPEEYSLVSTTLLFGFGLRYDIDRRSALSVEWINRRSNTDYLDDVSGSYIDSKEFFNYFVTKGNGTAKLAEQARQKANYPEYLNNVHIPGFLPGDNRGSGSANFKDYYYTILIKYHYYFDAKRLIGNISHGTKDDKDCFTRF